jgi:hypothetical protein
MRPHRLATGARWGATGRLVAVASALLMASAALMTSAAADPAQQRGSADPLVLIGVGGLRWSDVDPTSTPTLWHLVGRSSVGSVSVRAVQSSSCPIDAWLTVSSGQRALGAPGPETAPCPPLPRVVGRRVSGWDRYLRLQQEELASYGEPGVLGDGVARAGSCALAVGRGAAVALATSEGRVTHYAPSVTEADLSACAVTIVDAGALPADPDASALRTLDRVVAEVAAALPPGGELLVSGIADAPGGEPGLQVVIGYPAPAATPTWLTSNSTRRTGIIQLTDLTATVLTRVGASYAGVDGAPVQADEPRELDTAATVRDRLELATLTETLPRIAPWIGATYLLLVVVPLGLVAWVWRRRARRGDSPALAAGWRRLAVIVAVAAAVTPLSGYLVTLASWWTFSQPALVLLGAAGVVIAVVTLLALRPPLERLRREPWGPTLVVAALTFAVLTVDAAAGTPLQLGSPLVSGPVTGGRFYGFGNVTFAVYVTSALLFAGVLAQLVRTAYGGVAAGLTVSGLGVLAVLVEGWPSLGADFGGILAMVPGFGYLAWEVAGRRVTLRGAVALAAGAVAVTAAVGVLDWLRPAQQRSHFGSFVQKVIDGQADDVVARKAVAALQTLANPAGALALVVLVAAVAVVARPERFAGPGLAPAWQVWPTLLPTLRAVLVVAVLGSLLNDSGVLVAGAMLATALPHVLTAGLRAAGTGSPAQVIVAAP